MRTAPRFKEHTNRTFVVMLVTSATLGIALSWIRVVHAESIQAAEYAGSVLAMLERF